MSDIVFPFTLTAGQPENVNQLNANLAAIKTVVDSEIGTTNLEDGAVTFAKLAAAVQALLVPAGTILATGASAAPTGYLLCDGSSVLRATWPALFTAIGTTFGSADGTHFTLPDLRGRAAVGVDGAAGRLAANDALGQSGGVETVTLTAAQSGLVDHTHLVIGAVISATIDNGSAANVATTQVNATNGVTGGAQPASQAHTNLAPYLIVNHMIKT